MSKLKKFRWRGIDDLGRLISGKSFAENKQSIFQKMMAQGRIPLHIRETFQWQRLKIKPRHILEFLKTLSKLLSANIPLYQALQLLYDNHQLLMMREMVRTIQASLDQGFSLSQSMSKHPHLFKSFMIHWIEAGEQTGKLHLLLNQLITFLERTQNTRSKIKKAAFYPAIVLSVSLLVTMILLIFVVPQFQTLFSNTGGQLPALTQMVVKISQWIKQHGFQTVLSILLFGIGIRKTIKKFPVAFSFLHTIKMKLPGIGQCLQTSKLLQWSSVLATSCQAGMASFPALLLANEAVSDVDNQNALRIIAEQVKAGFTLHEALPYCNLFPNDFVERIRLGEESGQLTATLQQLIETETFTLDETVERLTKWLEPLFMLLISSIIGVLMIALYLPIFKMGSTI